MELRPLGEIMKILEQLGFTVTYAYDDLLFIEHTPFLLRFDKEESHKVFYFANIQLEEGVSENIFEKLLYQMNIISITLEDKGTFELRQKQGSEEEVEITFYENKVLQ